MAARVKYFIKTTKKIKFYEKTNGDVNVRILFSNGRKLKTTAISRQQINPNFWNNDKGEVRQVAAFKDKMEFQRRLDDLRYFILQEFNSASDQSMINNDWLNKIIDKFYNPDKYLEKGMTLFGFIRNFIENAEKRINPHTGNVVCYKVIREYNVTFEYLKKYAKLYGEPDFDDIDLDFYNNFIYILRKEGLKTNTIGHKFTTLKTFLNDATEKGVNKKLLFKSKNFKTLSEEVDNIYLTEDEIKILYSFDFSNNQRLEKVRDLFVVECWTGLRFSDINKINLDKIDNDMIYIRQNKTGKNAIIPIHPIVKEILIKYNGELPLPISNQKFNDYLKELAGEAGLNKTILRYKNINGNMEKVRYEKYQLISSHTARRSFCTNAYKAGLPIIAIMAISGHKTEKSFLKYIKLDREEHARMALDVWRKQYSDKYSFVLN